MIRTGVSPKRHQGEQHVGLTLRSLPKTVFLKKALQLKLSRLQLQTTTEIDCTKGKSQRNSLIRRSTNAMATSMKIGGGEETEKESSGGFQFEEEELEPCFVKEHEIKV